MKLSNKKQYISNEIVTGYGAIIIRTLIRINILLIALKVYKNPFTAYNLLIAVKTKKKLAHGNVVNLKFIKSSKSFFWSISSIGWPSSAFARFILNELHKIRPIQSHVVELQTIIFSITSRCPLQCDHCYEWDNLASNEILSLSELQLILKKIQEYGVSNIQFSGGEPLNRFSDLIKLISTVKPETNTWILTSGFELTLEKAKSLKNAGLTGVVISLDHWDEGSHNKFRNNQNSFYWVKEAIKNSLQADLVTAISLCAMKDFVTMDNLEKYMNFADKAGVNLIRILEPRRVGHFSNSDIELGTEQVNILKQFYLKTQQNYAYKHKPIIMYPGYHQREAGCFGAGNRYLYIDSKGDIHACPFCQDKVGNGLTDDLEKVINKMKRIGCHKFKTINAE